MAKKNKIVGYAIDMSWHGKKTTTRAWPTKEMADNRAKRLKETEVAAKNIKVVPVYEKETQEE
jgi:hypothetical protein